MIPKRPRKYRNQPVTIDGIKFDSGAEARRWQELKLLERAGKISNLTRQIPLVLLRSVKLHGDAKARPPVRIVVDFHYYDKMEACWRYEDVKGFETPMSKLKRHLAKALNGIDVEIVK